MFKTVLILYFSCYILLSNVESRAVENMESVEEKTANTPVEIETQKSSSGNFFIYKETDDPLFNIIDRIVNVTYISTQAAVNRLKNHKERIRDLGRGVDGFLEKIPTFPIPILDDMSHSKLFN